MCKKCIDGNGIYDRYFKCKVRDINKFDFKSALKVLKVGYTTRFGRQTQKPQDYKTQDSKKTSV
jgi:hypothetical protein